MDRMPTWDELRREHFGFGVTSRIFRLLTETYIKSLKRYFLTLNYKFLIFECQDDFGHRIRMAHDVIRPTYASDPPGIAL